ncbi:Spo0E family sporulation regulatory protein-aspartic acid phosphatase [Paenibacillus yanchengensis]|uniref:Spo0E family sporulation regulatory protein-aspartic acid phosphatase n=1 Tax=Paenibacillus yanchengensis TaxID=2035833 RepID=A0ABW4YG95_9BACL
MKERIEIMRTELNSLSNRYCIHELEMQRKSQQLDQLINQYYKLHYKKKQQTVKV